MELILHPFRDRTKPSLVTVTVTTCTADTSAARGLHTPGAQLSLQGASEDYLVGSDRHLHEMPCKVGKSMM